MLTIVCALYQEARKLIQIFQLKKESDTRALQVFCNKEKTVRLAVTGTGAVAGAVAAARMGACHPPKKQDVLVNFGSCAGKGCEPGDIFLCKKITDGCTGRSYYPDLLYRHPFAEAEIVTVAKPVADTSVGGIGCPDADNRGIGCPDTDSGGIGCPDADSGEIGLPACPLLYDMEAAAVYQAGSYDYGPHQMFFVKAVTDRGTSDAAFSKEQFSSVMDDAAEICAPFFRQLLETADDSAAVFEKNVWEEAERLGCMLHATYAMKAELGQLLRYWKLAGVDYNSRLAAYRQSARLPAKDKREGKKLLEELKAGLF